MDMVDKADNEPDRAPGAGGSFFSRWSKRKTDARVGEATFEEVNPAKPSIDGDVEAKSTEIGRQSTTLSAGSEAEETRQPPVLPSIASLTKDSDFSPFMQADVPPELRNQAMKKLFADPHYNVMDMLDTYVDDYSVSEPIPLDWLKKMSQSRALKLFDEAEESAPKDAGATEASAEPVQPALATMTPSNDLSQVEVPGEQVNATISLEKTPPGDT